MSKIIPGEPSAWEVRVRRIHPEVGEWKRYNIYETLERAQETVERTDGPPIEVKIVPLYAALEEA